MGVLCSNSVLLMVSLKLVPVIFVILISSFPPLVSSQAPVRYQDQDCLDCHGKPEIHQTIENGRTRPIYVNPEQWTQDVHYKSRMACVDCHQYASPSLHFREGFLKADCTRCHPEEAEEYTKNIHFEYRNVSPNKELPQCYDCHTKHHVLLHDDPESSVHEKNIGETCRICHAEVMVKGIINGTSLGKISGHRKGDLSEKFDMNVCISCHYEDSAHGPKRAYKEFCLRCHDVRKKGNAVMGPIHLDSIRWTGFNAVGNGLAVSLLLGFGVYIGYQSHRKIVRGMKSWLERMKIEEDTKEEAHKETNSAETRETTDVITEESPEE